MPRPFEPLRQFRSASATVRQLADEQCERLDATQVAAARKMSDITRTYVPMLPAIFRLDSNYVQPWLLGFSPIFQPYFKYLDIDVARRRQATGK